MKKNPINLFTFWIVSFLLMFQFAFAQGDRAIRINEFLVHNESNYIDDYGNHTAWIEIFNEAYNPINVSMMYVTNDINNPRKYRIPEAGKKTIIPPRGFLMLFADNKPNRGVFHLNFVLENDGYIAIFDSDGRTLMDSVHYKSQKTDVTYGRVIDGSGTWGYLSKSTPNSSNVTEIRETSAEEFQRIDSIGIGLTVISMTIVFAALLILFFIYKLMGIIYQKKLQITLPKARLQTTSKEMVGEKHLLSGEVNAAIAAAIYLYVSEIHDFENTTITIKKVARPYSPWSSKIYSIRNNPRK